MKILRLIGIGLGMVLVVAILQLPDPGRNMYVSQYTTLPEADLHRITAESWKSGGRGKALLILDYMDENKLDILTGKTKLFVLPGYNIKTIDGLITNFHLPKSTLLMLVASFLENKGSKSPIDDLFKIYDIAIQNRYRFYSFGDAMLII